MLFLACWLLLLLVGASAKEGSHLREIVGDQPALFQGMPEKVNAAR